MHLSHIQAWASALPSNSNRQCEKPPIVGRATSTDNSRFFRTRSNQEMSIEHKYKPVILEGHLTHLQLAAHAMGKRIVHLQDF